jgi:hypothetical protein
MSAFESLNGHMSDISTCPLSANSGSRSFDRDRACGARIGVAYKARMQDAPGAGCGNLIEEFRGVIVPLHMNRFIRKCVETVQALRCSMTSRISSATE